MDCCSPDVGDCQKCHPELWIQKPGSYCNWIPKKVGSKVSVNGGQRVGSKGGLPPFNRTRSKPSRHRVLTRKKRIY